MITPKFVVITTDTLTGSCRIRFWTFTSAANQALSLFFALTPIVALRIATVLQLIFVK
jgi:hypothetical protein